MTELRAAILAEVRSLLGVPWLHQGRSKAGVDCPALATIPLRTLNLSTFDLRNYDRLPSGMELMKLCDEQMTRISVASMQPADVAIFRLGRHPQHLAIVGDRPFGGLSMIHADNRPGIGRVVENRIDDRWMKRLAAAFRMPGVPE